MAAGGTEGRPTVPARVFCDTSYFYACADTDDIYHRQALAMAAEAVSRGTQLWTTWDVINETITLLRYRHSAAAAMRFLDGAEVRVEAEHVFRRHGRDHRLSFCDAISFVVVTTLLQHMPCFAFDEDFRRLGLSVIMTRQ